MNLSTTITHSVETICAELANNGWWIMQISQHNWTIESGIPNWSAVAHKTPDRMYMGSVRGEGNTILECITNLKLNADSYIFTEITMPNSVLLNLDDKIKPAKELPDFMQDILANLRPKVVIDRRF